ncbi:hypothetical protein FQA39_LY03620 [Lamprigera yunnana]|nr:hypothetical protein FQA39_LY03620 [Lamprigera yunnana]
MYTEETNLNADEDPKKLVAAAHSVVEGESSSNAENTFQCVTLNSLKITKCYPIPESEDVAVVQKFQKSTKRRHTSRKQFRHKDIMLYKLGNDDKETIQKKQVLDKIFHRFTPSSHPLSKLNNGETSNGASPSVDDNLNELITINLNVANNITRPKVLPNILSPLLFNNSDVPQNNAIVSNPDYSGQNFNYSDESESNQTLGKHNLPIRLPERRRSIAEPLRTVPICKLLNASVDRAANDNLILPECSREGPGVPLSHPYQEHPSEISNIQDPNENVTEISNNTPSTIANIVSPIFFSKKLKRKYLPIEIPHNSRNKQFKCSSPPPQELLPETSTLLTTYGDLKDDLLIDVQPMQQDQAKYTNFDDILNVTPKPEEPLANVNSSEEYHNSIESPYVISDSESENEIKTEPIDNKLDVWKTSENKYVDCCSVIQSATNTVSQSLAFFALTMNSMANVLNCDLTKKQEALIRENLKTALKISEVFRKKIKVATKKAVKFVEIISSESEDEYNAVPKSTTEEKLTTSAPSVPKNYSNSESAITGHAIEPAPLDSRGASCSVRPTSTLPHLPPSENTLIAHCSDRPNNVKENYTTDGHTMLRNVRTFPNKQIMLEPHDGFQNAVQQLTRYASQSDPRIQLQPQPQPSKQFQCRKPSINNALANYKCPTYNSASTKSTNIGQRAHTFDAPPYKQNAQSWYQNPSTLTEQVDYNQSSKFTNPYSQTQIHPQQPTAFLPWGPRNNQVPYICPAHPSLHHSYQAPISTVLPQNSYYASSNVAVPMQPTQYNTFLSPTNQNLRTTVGIPVAANYPAMRSTYENEHSNWQPMLQQYPINRFSTQPHPVEKPKPHNKNIQRQFNNTTKSPSMNVNLQQNYNKYGNASTASEMAAPASQYYKNTSNPKTNLQLPLVDKNKGSRSYLPKPTVDFSATDVRASLHNLVGLGDASLSSDTSADYGYFSPISITSTECQQTEAILNNLTDLNVAALLSSPEFASGCINDFTIEKLQSAKFHPKEKEKLLKLLPKLQKNELLTPEQYIEEMSTLENNDCPSHFLKFYAFITKRQIFKNQRPIGFRLYLEFQMYDKLTGLKEMFKVYSEKHEQEKSRPGDN